LYCKDDDKGKIHDSIKSLYIVIQNKTNKMPLHRIYHPLSAFSSTDKAALSERITELYVAAGLPAFYVVVLFIPIDKESFFVGGKSTDKFVRIVAQHLARQIPTDEGKKKFVEKYENALAPFIKDKGYDWEVRYTILFGFLSYLPFAF
jgi:phenylpyruvate tautomerase PptA (4-oxalocrotonate tautomerase family)